jgi:hypothetical protein
LGVTIERVMRVGWVRVHAETQIVEIMQRHRDTDRHRRTDTNVPDSAAEWPAGSPAAAPAWGLSRPSASRGPGGCSRGRRPIVLFEFFWGGCVD